MIDAKRIVGLVPSWVSQPGIKRKEIVIALAGACIIGQSRREDRVTKKKQNGWKWTEGARDGHAPFADSGWIERREGQGGGKGGENKEYVDAPCLNASGIVIVIGPP
jgi:hypothetical protein